MSLRVSLKFIGQCFSTDMFLCVLILSIGKNGMCEMWVKCPSAISLLELIKYALNKGFLLLEIGFLSGLRRRGFELDLREISEHGFYDAEISGVIEVEYYKPVSMWMDFLPFKKLYVRSRSNRAFIELNRAVKLSTLFDCGVRLVKPYKCPP